MLCSNIIKRYRIFFCIATNLIANLVVQVVHQPTFLDRIDFIKGASNMKTYCTFRQISFLSFLFWRQSCYLFFRIPTFIGTSKFKFVSVFLRLYTSQYWLKRWKFNLTNACQLIKNLLLFGFQLLLVWQILPFTSTANTKVFAHRSFANLAI